MDLGRDPGSGLFNRNELPQSYGTERAPLAPVPTKPDEAAPRARAGSVPRLAVEAKASTGSGLIDLDAVARSVEAKRRASETDAEGESSAADSAGAPTQVGSSSLALAAARIDVAAPPVVSTVDSARVPVGPDRRLLLTSIALLAVVGCLLGYLAIT